LIHDLPHIKTKENLLFFVITELYEKQSLGMRYFTTKKRTLPGLWRHKLDIITVKQ